MTAGKTILAMAILAVTPMTTSPSFAAMDVARVGSAAPDFTATDITGQPRRLSEFKGKTVDSSAIG